MTNETERAWTQDEIDEDVFRCEEVEDCDCQFADVDILEGRGHCPMCGRTWYLTGDELRAELAYQAEYGQAIEDEMASRVGETGDGGKNAES